MMAFVTKLRRTPTIFGELSAYFAYYFLVIMLTNITGIVMRFCGVSFEVTSLLIGVTVVVLFLVADGLLSNRSLKGGRRTTFGPGLVTHTHVFESLSFRIGKLPSTCLSPTGALGSDEAGLPPSKTDPEGVVTTLSYDALGRVLTRTTDNNTAELGVDVRVIPLSELFDPAILEMYLPWAGPALHLVKAAAEETSQSRTIYIGAIDTRKGVRNQHGVLQVFLITPNGKQAELRLRALRPSGMFESEHVTDDWLQYTLKVSIEDK